MNAPLMLLARILISLIFVQGALGKMLGWEGQIAYMQSHGMHRLLTPLLAAALFIEMAGVICLLTGFAARAAAAVMFVYLILLSVLLHDFWSAQPGSAGMMQAQFLKNIGIAGGLLMLAACGPGRWSLGSEKSRAHGSRP